MTHKSLAIFPSPRDLINFLEQQRSTKTKQAKANTNNKTYIHMSDPLDLNIDLSGVDTTYPSLNAGTVPMMIVDSKVEPWKSDPSSRSWVLTLETTDRALSASGADLNPGFKQTFRLNLQPGKSKDGEEIDHLRPLTLGIEAIFGERRSLNSETISAAVGRAVLAVVKNRKNPDDGFGATEIKSLKPAI